MHTMNPNLTSLIPREVLLRIHRIGDKLAIKEVRGCILVRGADGRGGSDGLTFPEAMQTHIRRQERVEQTLINAQQVCRLGSTACRLSTASKRSCKIIIYMLTEAQSRHMSAAIQAADEQYSRRNVVLD